MEDSLEDKSIPLHSKKTFLLLLAWSGTEYTWAFIWKKSLLIYFESYQVIQYPHTVREDRNMNNLLMVSINLICRDSLEHKSMLFLM